MFIDEKGKLFGKINIVDLCILLAIVVGIGGLAVSMIGIKYNDSVKSVLQSDTKEEKVTLEVGLLLKEVRDITRDAIIVGDEVFTTSSDTSLGKIIKVESEPSKKNILTYDGQVFNAVVPEKYDVTIYVETEAIKKETGYYGEENLQFLFGKYHEIKTTNIKTTPMISSIKEVK